MYRIQAIRTFAIAFLREWSRFEPTTKIEMMKWIFQSATTLGNLSVLGKAHQVRIFFSLNLFLISEILNTQKAFAVILKRLWIDPHTQSTAEVFYHYLLFSFIHTISPRSFFTSPHLSLKSRPHQ
jgi:hypothetical protein